MNIAWSTAAVLALLLPGFFFVRGIGLAEPFSRDATPRSPIALLALTVLVSICVHAVGLWAVRASGMPCDVGAVLALSAGQPSSPEVLNRVVSAIEPYERWIAAYFATVGLAGLALGGMLGLAGRRFQWLGRWLFEHAWLHELSDPTRRAIVYALTDVEYCGTRVLYVGEVERFGVKQDGRFSFLLLKNASRGKLVPDGHADGMQWKALKKERVGVLYLDGESIANLFVQYEALPKAILDDGRLGGEAIKVIQERITTGSPHSSPPPSRSTTPTGS